MTFTLNLTLPLSNLTRVRLAIGDIHEDAPIFSDELINAQIAAEGTWQKATIACLRTLIADLSSRPDFQADWLKVDASTAIRALQERLADLQAQHELLMLDASSVQGITWANDADG